MRSSRLSAAQLGELLSIEPPGARRLVRGLRRTILAAAPDAAEGVRFNSLCYYDPAAPYGAIGGNICMIEVRGGEVALSFLQGAELRDPHRLLEGTGKAKRRVPIDEGNVDDPRVRALITAAATCARRRAEFARSADPSRQAHGRTR